MPVPHDRPTVQSRCGHAPCTCAPRPGDPYCSDACREAARAGSPAGGAGCRCQHPGCHG